jgi:kynurenine formamidase
VNDLAEITKERCLIMVMPLKLVGFEGASARVSAIEPEGGDRIDFVLKD